MCTYGVHQSAQARQMPADAHRPPAGRSAIRSDEAQPLARSRSRCAASMPASARVGRAEIGSATDPIIGGRPALASPTVSRCRLIISPSPPDARRRALPVRRCVASSDASDCSRWPRSAAVAGALSSPTHIRERPATSPRRCAASMPASARVGLLSRGSVNDPRGPSFVPPADAPRLSPTVSRCRLIISPSALSPSTRLKIGALIARPRRCRPAWGPAPE